MKADITIKRVGIAELEPLLTLSKKTFFDAFYHLNKPEDMEAYAAKVFNTSALTAELSDPSSEFYFACIDSEVVGYLKLNYATAQTDLNDSSSVEIERIYVSNYHQGKNIGQQLIAYVKSMAILKDLKFIWLGVWEHNFRAIKFYERQGFEVFGKHYFMLGNDKQTDILMKMIL